MALYLIGLGLNEKSITVEALEIIKKSDKIYLENYTVDFPYTIKELEKSLKVKITPLEREKVEDLTFLNEAKEKNISLLIYGDALSATTHITIVLECKNRKIPYKIFHNSSILTAIAETGLSLYKFGKTASLPDWKQHTNKPTSFIDYIKENKSIKAHTLLLVDIGLELKDAIAQIKKATLSQNLKLPKKIIIISNAGTENQKIFYDTPINLENEKIKMPFCLIIPTELHFIEEEALELLRE